MCFEDLPKHEGMIKQVRHRFERFSPEGATRFQLMRSSAINGGCSIGSVVALDPLDLCEFKKNPKPSKSPGCQTAESESLTRRFETFARPAQDL